MSRSRLPAVLMAVAQVVIWRLGAALVLVLVEELFVRWAPVDNLFQVSLKVVQITQDDASVVAVAGSGVIVATSVLVGSTCIGRSSGAAKEGSESTQCTDTAWLASFRCTSIQKQRCSGIGDKD